MASVPPGVARDELKLGVRIVSLVAPADPGNRLL